MSSFCILEISPLSVASFANIFSHYEDCLFILIMVSFTVQKLLNYLPFVYFYFHYSRRWVKEDLAVFLSTSVLPMFSSKSFVVSALTVKFLIHLEFIFVKL